MTSASKPTPHAIANERTSPLRSTRPRSIGRGRPITMVRAAASIRRLMPRLPASRLPVPAGMMPMGDPRADQGVGDRRHGAIAANRHDHVHGLLGGSGRVVPERRDVRRGHDFGLPARLEARRGPAARPGRGPPRGRIDDDERAGQGTNRGRGDRTAGTWAGAITVALIDRHGRAGRTPPAEPSRRTRESANPSRRTRHRELRLAPALVARYRVAAWPMRHRTSPGARFPTCACGRRPTLLGLPWELPLGSWTAARVGLRELPIGPSRHLVRFVQDETRLIALKEEPLDIARREYEVLRRLESPELPAVRAVGLAEPPERGKRDPGHRVPGPLAPVPPAADAAAARVRRPYRDRLLDAMASLLVDLHRGGVYWGDCSLANTLFRRDGDLIQAYLVDAETSEIHADLSDGQRDYDLEVLVENVAFGLADLAALTQGRPEDFDGDPRRPRASGTATRPVERAPRRAGAGAPATGSPITGPGPPPQRARVRGRRDRARARRRMRAGPAAGRGRRPRRFHARELERRTGLVALEGQARILMNDLREYRAWLEWFEHRRPIDAPRAPSAGCDEVFRADARPARAGDRPRPRPRSRPTATCSSTSGCSPSRPAGTSASRPRSLLPRERCSGARGAEWGAALDPRKPRPRSRVDGTFS